jgi:hypothetical protein
MEDIFDRLAPLGIAHFVDQNTISRSLSKSPSCAIGTLSPLRHLQYLIRCGLNLGEGMPAISRMTVKVW